MKEMEKKSAVNEGEDLIEQARVRREKLKELVEAGKDPFTITKFDRTSNSEEILGNFEKMENQEVAIAGRIMTMRIMGKAAFCDIRDHKGRIQAYVRVDEIGKDNFKEFKKYDLGDIVGIKGFVFKTQKGEISVHVKEITLLAKALLPLPDKWHGLKDTDTRYRQRYVDLIVNPEVKDTFVKRSRILREIRNFLDSKGFLEVDTPILVPLEIAASAKPFTTHHNTLDLDMTLRIETELYLKRLIVGGMDRVYEVGRIFRNEGMDTKHNPEFTSVELYQAYTDYKGMMDLVEELYIHLAKTVCGSTTISYQGKEIDMSHWERMTMAEAVKKYSGVDYYSWESDADARASAKEKKVEVPTNATKGTVLAEFFDAFVEENLIQPTFIYDYPVENSPLAKRKPENPAFTERFEYFINATEFGNSFSELNDPIDQKGRFEYQLEKKREENPATKAAVDYDYVTALEYGLAPTGGLGFGVDRLVMLLTDSDSIRDVLLFPTMKPLDAKTSSASGEENAAEEAPAVSASKTVATDHVAPKYADTIDMSNLVMDPLFEDMVDFDTFAKSDYRAVKVKECEAVKKSKKLLKFTLDDGSGTDRVILSGIHEYYEPEDLVGKTLLAITNLPPRKMMGIDSCGMIISAVYHNGDDERLNLIQLDDFIPAGAKMY